MTTFKTLKKLPGISIEKSNDSRSIGLSFNGRLKYDVYPDGRIYFYRYGYNYSTPERKLARGRLTKNGYVMVLINGSQFYYHRVIAELFIPCENGRPCVNHKDGNKVNNAASNLEWASYGENHKHAYAKLGRKAWHAGKNLGGGVSFDKERGKWMAYVHNSGRKIYLGRFISKHEAIESRDAYRESGMVY